ncbi:MAG: hypothetical protein IKA79_06930, partial [Lentisphaeria bacterium]|nr:hypothetical protein [Lentisphaeria bacterium]
MSDLKEKIDFGAGSAKLQQLLAPYEERTGKKRPAFHSEEWDRDLIRNGILNETELVKLYSQAYGTDFVEEEELSIPELYPDAPMEYFNAVPALPFSWDEDTITFLVCSP